MLSRSVVWPMEAAISAKGEVTDPVRPCLSREDYTLLELTWY